MFIQVIEGKVTDQAAMHQQLERWERDLKPGAIGYLASTGGFTSAGDCILIARFESADAARRNSERPEQGAWWAETERLFDGPARFHDTEEVHVMTHGDLDRARFVQIMEGHVTDHQRAAELEDTAEPMLKEHRPDLLGSVTAYFDGDEYAEIAYFTTEAAARAAEGSPIPDEAMALVQEWGEVLKVDRYLDLTDPWLIKR